MSEINIEKGKFKELSFKSLDAETIGYLRTILNAEFVAIPPDFRFLGNSAIWDLVNCGHYELELTLGDK